MLIPDPDALAIVTKLLQMFHNFDKQGRIRYNRDDHLRRSGDRRTQACVQATRYSSGESP